jgi:hypothetical protein
MIACTERQVRKRLSGGNGEGRKSMPKEGTA